MKNDIKNGDEGELLSGDGEIDLSAFVRVLWKSKFIIIASLFLFSLGGIMYALSLPNIYTSSAILAPKQLGESDGVSGLTSQLGGLANVGGFNLGGISNTFAGKDVIALEKMKSLKFFKDYIYEAVVIDLFAAKSWSADEKKMEYDSSIYDFEENVWLREPVGHKQAKPSFQEAYIEFKSISSVGTDDETGLVSIRVLFISPDLAKSWVDIIVAGINEEMKNIDVVEAEKSVKFLVTQREQNSLMSIRDVFARLIEENTKKIVLANISDEYMYRVIEPAVVAETRSSPNRVMICFWSLLIGLVLSLSAVLIRNFLLPPVDRDLIIFKR